MEFSRCINYPKHKFSEAEKIYNTHGIQNLILSVGTGMIAKMNDIVQRYGMPGKSEKCLTVNDNDYMRILTLF